MKNRYSIAILPLFILILMLPLVTRAQVQGASAQSTTYTAETLLTKTPVAGDTIKWIRRAIFDYKTIFNKDVDVYGLATFFNNAAFKALTSFKDVKVNGTTTLGSDGTDAVKIEGKISHDDGVVYIKDDLRITGNLNLETASIGSAEIQDGTVQPADLARSYQEALVNTIVVHANGTAAENGDQLYGALNGITNNSSTHPYLIKLEPGVYDLEIDYLAMKEYVDLEGAGEGVTIVKGHLGSDTIGIINGAANSEIRSLTIENFTSSANATGVYLGASSTLSHVTVNVTAGTNILYGIRCNSANPSFKDVTVTVDGSAAWESGSAAALDLWLCTPTLNNSSFTVKNAKNNYGIIFQNNEQHFENSSFFASGGERDYAIYAGGVTVNLNNCIMEASGGSVSSYGFYGGSTIGINRSSMTGGTASFYSTGNAFIGSSFLYGPSSAGSMHCASVYNEDYEQLTSTCGLPS